MARYNLRQLTHYNLRKGRERMKYQKQGMSKLSLLNKKNFGFPINELPSMILIKVFSFLSLQELFFNIRLVCKYWCELASSTSLWHTIDAGPDIPTDLLLKWLKRSPKLKSLRLQYRIDAGQILRQVHKYNKNIKQLKVHNCCGCILRVNIPSRPLCNILLQCPYLDSISLNGSRFISCKFFRILAMRDLILAKRKRFVDHKRRSKAIKFSGSAFKKQLRTFLKSRLECCSKSQVSVFTSKSQNDNVDQRREIFVRDSEDIERVLNSINFV